MGRGGKREPGLVGGKALDLARRLLQSKPSKPLSCRVPRFPSSLALTVYLDV